MESFNSWALKGGSLNNLKVLDKMYKIPSNKCIKAPHLVNNLLERLLLKAVLLALEFQPSSSQLTFLHKAMLLQPQQWPFK